MTKRLVRVEGTGPVELSPEAEEAEGLQAMLASNRLEKYVRHREHLEDPVLDIRSAARALYAFARPTRSMGPALNRMPHTLGDEFVHLTIAQLASDLTECPLPDAVFDGLAMGMDDVVARGIPRARFAYRFAYALERSLATRGRLGAEDVSEADLYAAEEESRTAAWKWCHEGAVRVFGADDETALVAAYERAKSRRTPWPPEAVALAWSQARALTARYGKGHEAPLRAYSALAMVAHVLGEPAMGRLLAAVEHEAREHAAPWLVSMAKMAGYPAEAHGCALRLAERAEVLALAPEVHIAAGIARADALTGMFEYAEALTVLDRVLPRMPGGEPRYWAASTAALCAGHAVKGEDLRRREQLVREILAAGHATTEAGECIIGGLAEEYEMAGDARAIPLMRALVDAATAEGNFQVLKSARKTLARMREKPHKPRKR
jgi:hypothetical protein